MGGGTPDANVNYVFGWDMVDGDSESECEGGSDVCSLLSHLSDD